MKKRYKTIEIEISSWVMSLLSEINQQCLPLFDLWERENTNGYFVTFNSVRIIMPILESASKIEYPHSILPLLEKLKVPLPEISWCMFRHGLSHSTRPFIIKYKGQSYQWGIKQFTGFHYISSDNVVMISPRQLVDDLKKYLETFRYNNNKIKIQTGVEFI